MLESDLKNQIIRKILAVTSPREIRLFGSYATGKETPDSDLDLLVVYDRLLSKIEEKRKIRKALQAITLPKDILVASSDEFDFYRHETGSVYRDAAESGEVLWSA